MMPVVEQLMANHIGIIEHDTLPGIVARMTPENANMMNAIKGRSPSKGFIVLIPNVDWVSPLATSVSEQAKALMAKHWPGPLTIILNKHPNVPDAITGGRQTIALRYPKHALLTSVLRNLTSLSLHQCQHEHSHGDHPSTFKCRSIYPWGYPW